ncbi:MAG: ATP-binding cassette domain-containing protein [Helicobacter sp.]|nr:ATP-binding cassette domain-containing protein [Helicobacter sp.]
MDSSIDVRDISITYNNGHRAIYDVSFNIKGGSICGLLGVNGSGKSTLFKSIMGLVTPQKGQIHLCNMPIKKALKQNLVSYVPQSEDVDWQFPVSVYDVVMMGRYGYMSFLRNPKEEDKKQVQSAMERVNISHLTKRQIGELSGGQKKRVFLARALAQSSRVILLDEPFTGVDVKTESAITDLLLELKSQGHLILISTHNLGSVSDFCDQVIMINRTILCAGPVATTFNQKNLELAFGGVLRHIKLESDAIHSDEDERAVTILTDDERAAVFYGKEKSDPPATTKNVQNIGSSKPKETP